MSYELESCPDGAAKMKQYCKWSNIERCAQAVARRCPEDGSQRAGSKGIPILSHANVRLQTLRTAREQQDSLDTVAKPFCQSPFVKSTFVKSPFVKALLSKALLSKPTWHQSPFVSAHRLDGMANLNTIQTLKLKLRPRFVQQVSRQIGPTSSFLHLVIQPRSNLHDNC